MVRLLVRKSLLSAWTSSRLYGRRRTGHGGGRSVHPRTVASAVTAGDDEARDIRLDVLFFSCCYSGDGRTSCCCCCMTDEECQGNLPATSSFLSVLLLHDCLRSDWSTYSASLMVASCVLVLVVSLSLLVQCACFFPIQAHTYNNNDNDNNNKTFSYPDEAPDPSHFSMWL